MRKGKIANKPIIEYLQTRQENINSQSINLIFSIIKNIVIYFSYNQFSKYVNFSVELPRKTNNNISCHFPKLTFKKSFNLFQSRFQIITYINGNHIENICK